MRRQDQVGDVTKQRRSGFIEGLLGKDVERGPAEMPGAQGLDVFESEPLSGADAARFAGIDNLVLTPHIAGVTEESNVRVSRVTVRNVLEHLEATT